jgi:hypothetical protein
VTAIKHDIFISYSREDTRAANAKNAEKRPLGDARFRLLYHET